MSVGLMARKKAASKSVVGGGHREELVSFRCYPAFKAHLERIADEETRTPTQVIERALRAYAAANGHEPFPDR